MTAHAGSARCRSSDIADPAFSVTSAAGAAGAEVRLVRADQLRPGGAPVRPGVPADQAPGPAAGQQAVARPPRHHLRAVRGLVGQLGPQHGGRGASPAAPPAEPGLLPPDRRGAAAALRRTGRRARRTRSPSRAGASSWPSSPSRTRPGSSRSCSASPRRSGPRSRRNRRPIGLAMGVRIREHLPRIEAALAALYDYADAVIADRRRPRPRVTTGARSRGWPGRGAARPGRLA